MPEIRGTIQRDATAPELPCVWCEEGTATRAETPGRPDLGSVPLHVFCAGAVVVAYDRWRNGRLEAGSELANRLGAYQARLLLLAAVTPR